MTDQNSTEKNAEAEQLVDRSTEAKKPSRLRRCLVYCGRLVLFGYGTLLVMLVVMETRLVYPGAYMNVPNGSAAGVTAVEYQSKDGTKLVGRLFEKPDAKHVMVYFHGNGITAARESQAIASLGQEFNANVLAAEYRGFNSLDGTPNESGVIADSFAARDFVCERYGVQPNQLVLFGQSLGGGCAVAVASDSGAKVLALDRTFDSMVDVAQGMYWFVPVKFLMRNRFDSVERIQNYTGPLVQMHGNADRLIPIKHGEHLHEAATSKVKHWVVAEGMGHNNATPPKAWNEFSTHIQDLLQ